MALLPIPLPESTTQLLAPGVVPYSERHPGLQLDKFIQPPHRQEDQKTALEPVLKTSGDPGLLAALLQRRRQWLIALRAATFAATTTGPLTLHLARASALENAGICLHPLYGFVYFPGSGLKGMARAYAETVWLPARLAPDWSKAPEAEWNKALDQLDAVFGFAVYVEPKKEERKQMSEFALALNDKRKQRDRQRAEAHQCRAAAGNIVFHDAWPESWPRLIMDILNNHHADYYQHDDNDHPPGDWENPVPVYFLAVQPGVTFTFALAKRRDDVPDELLALAQHWLLGALCHLGAGAKTAAGYGAFKPADTEPLPIVCQKLATYETTLELVTPAFLAGPNQAKDDCDLRPATLRGLLRWWWRTMHAGFVDVKTLRAMEAAIWGDTNTGGAVRITVQRAEQSPVTPVPMPGKKIQRIEKAQKSTFKLRADPDFLKTVGLIAPPNERTTQGLFYISYGMDEMPAGKPQDRKQRFMMPPGAKWRVQLTAREGFYRPPGTKSPGPLVRLPAKTVLQQAQAALWLLCQYGGVGSKGRNGFGSLAQLGESLDEGKQAVIEKAAAEFRQTCGVQSRGDTHPQVPALNHALPVLSISTPWKNFWFVLDQLGYSIQAFAQKHKRNWIKEALGLPRKIGTSNNDGTRDRGYAREGDASNKQTIVWLGQKHPYLANRQPKDMRHAAPVHFHIDRKADGTYDIRAIAFPCAVLPDWNTSNKVLKQLLDHLKSDIAQRCKSNPQGPPAVSVPSAGAPAAATSQKRPYGTPVRVKIIASRPNGGYDVQEEGKPQGTLTLGTPPAVLPQIGEMVDAKVHNDDPKRPQYSWP